MNTLEALTKARELITPPQAWTKQTFAKDAGGGAADPCSTNAVCWCSLGALERVVAGEDWEGYTDATSALESAAHCSIATFNDNHTHEEVLALFDRAIEMEKAK